MVNIRLDEAYLYHLPHLISFSVEWRAWKERGQPHLLGGTDRGADRGLDEDK